MEHRSISLGPGLLVATELPRDVPSHVLRRHPLPHLPYDRDTVVTELDGGAELFMQLWRESPHAIAEWRDGMRRLFPHARWVGWERRLEDGSFRQFRRRL